MTSGRYLFFEINFRINYKHYVSVHLLNFCSYYKTIDGKPFVIVMV